MASRISRADVGSSDPANDLNAKTVLSLVPEARDVTNWSTSFCSSGLSISTRATILARASIAVASVSRIRLENHPPPKQIQRRLHRRHPNPLPLPYPPEFPGIRPVRSRNPDKTGAHRYLLGPAFRPREAGHRHTVRRARALASTVRHRPSDRVAHRRVLFQNVGIHAKQRRLYRLRVHQEAAGEIARAPRHGRNPLAQHPAGAALGDSDRRVALVEHPAHDD